MSKRYTETAKWADPWFRGLTPRQKALWLWLLDNCDCAGVVPEVDWGLASFQIGEAVAESDMAVFAGRVEVCGRGWWITKFVAFQWGKIDGETTSGLHKGVIKALAKASIPLAKAMGSLPKGLGNPTDTVAEAIGKATGSPKDKDKDKDKELELVEDGSTEGSARPKPKAKTDEEWLAELATVDAYRGIDVTREYGKARVWCEANNQQLTRRRFANWLNRCKPMSATAGQQRTWTPNEEGGF